MLYVNLEYIIIVLINKIMEELTELELEYTYLDKFKVSTNKIYAGCHWTKRNAISSYFHNLVLSDCKNLPKFNDKIDIHFLFTFKGRCLDSSNCSYMAKCLEDWFRKWWLIKDDSIKYIWKFSLESIKWSQNKINVSIKVKKS